MQAYRYKLNLQFFAQEKTEKATPKKRKEAREKGQVARSMEIPGAFVMLSTFAGLMMFAGYFKEQLYRLFTVPFRDYMNWSVTTETVGIIFGYLTIQALMMLAPLFLIALAAAFITNYVQFGLLLTGHPLMPKFSKLNPIEGAKRIFSLRAAIEFLKSMFKMLVIGFLVFSTLWNEKEKLISLSRLPLENVFAYAADLTVTLGIQVAACLAVLAIFDYMYQKYDFEKNLRMSKQDIKDEYKKTEGDPLIKSKIRERQRRMAMQRMMQEVPKADVVITNPTHYAVALRYDPKEMDAPKVIAKGQDYVALKIKELARKHGIVTMENKPLAQALYHQVEIGQTIPTELFQAVAEVLAYVYRLKKKA
jgi:flagellar biosynthetic protein FlhB